MKCANKKKKCVKVWQKMEKNRSELVNGSVEFV